MNELRNYLRTSFSKSVLLDTGVVVDFLMGDRKAVGFFDEFVSTAHITPVLSPQSISELFMAARNRGEETKLDRWLAKTFSVADMTYEIAKEAGLLKRNSGINAANSIIAATAKHLGIPLVTTNPESYRRTEMRIFRPYA
jgi:predicted nucleic acid-binding protein